MDIDEGAARAAATKVLATWPAPPEPDESVEVWRVEEHSRAWIVHFATRRWIATKNFREQLVGACPFVVDKATGEVHVYGSGPAEHARFKSWLDPES